MHVYLGVELKYSPANWAKWQLLKWCLIFAGRKFQHSSIHWNGMEIPFIPALRYFQWLLLVSLLCFLKLWAGCWQNYLFICLAIQNALWTFYNFKAVYKYSYGPILKLPHGMLHPHPVWAVALPPGKLDRIRLLIICIRLCY